jgi:hypothetical protein
MEKAYQQDGTILVKTMILAHFVYLPLGNASVFGLPNPKVQYLMSTERKKKKKHLSRKFQKAINITLFCSCVNM